MIRFALIVASTLGFVLTAAMGNLMVPLLRAFQSRNGRTLRQARTRTKRRSARPSRPRWAGSA